MKKLIQLLLLSLIIFISILFYKIYFSNQNDKKIIENKKEESTLDNKSNLIKNLEYNVTLDDNSQYAITADESELIYVNNIELVSMSNVTATFFSKDGSILTITSDKAIFNSSIYDTEFRENVIVKYLDNSILSDKLDLNFNENIVTIYDNVIYEGLKGNILTDNIVIDLITKNVELFMSNSKKKVIVNTK